MGRGVDPQPPILEYKMAKKMQPTVSVNLSLFEDIRKAEEELKEARQDRIGSFMMGDDGENLLLNALGSLLFDSFKKTHPKERGEGEKDNPNFGRRTWTVGMIWEMLPEDWKTIVNEKDVSTRLLNIWKDQGGKIDGDKPVFGQNAGWLTVHSGVGRALVLYGLDTSKIPTEE